MNINQNTTASVFIPAITTDIEKRKGSGHVKSFSFNSNGIADTATREFSRTNTPKSQYSITIAKTSKLGPISPVNPNINPNTSRTLPNSKHVSLAERLRDHKTLHSTNEKKTTFWGDPKPDPPVASPHKALEEFQSRHNSLVEQMKEQEKAKEKDAQRSEQSPSN